MADLLSSYQNVINLTLINSILALSAWVTWTHGIISLAGAGFMALGAYSAGVLTTQFDLPIVVALMAGTLIGAAVGAPLAKPLARLRGHYLAIATLGFSMVVMVAAVNWKSVTGGTLGMFGLPGMHSALILLGILAVICALCWLVTRSHIGRAMYAVGGDEIVSGSFGIDVGTYRLGAFIASGALAGLAGGLYAFQIRVLTPESFDENMAFLILAFAILGGLRHWSGPVVGALLLTVLPEVSRFIGEYREVLVGAVLLTVVLFLPQGIVQPARFSRWIRRRVHLRRGRKGHRDSEESAEVPALARASLDSLNLPRHPSSASQQTPLLEVRNVTKRYGGIAALNDVSLELTGGRVYGLIGPNGSGKSTLLNSISGHVEVDSGSISISGENVARLRPSQRVRFGVTRTFQSPRVDPNVTVHQNIAVGTHWVRKASFVPTLLRRGKGKQEHDRFTVLIDQLIDVLHLSRHRTALGDALSFGQKRLVELGRALVGGPRLLLLDEPASGMNPALVVELREHLEALREMDMTVLLVEHDIEFVMNLCDHIFVLAEGALLAEGTPEQVRNDPRVLEAYLGTRAVTAANQTEV